MELENHRDLIAPDAHVEIRSKHKSTFIPIASNNVYKGAVMKTNKHGDPIEIGWARLSITK